MYLLDTNVISELRKQKKANPGVQEFFQIAATALVCGLTLVTRNVSDFVETGVLLLNPFSTES